MSNVIYDIETYKNVFTACFKSVSTNNKKQIILTKDTNNAKEFYEFLLILKTCKYSLVGFNNVWFDAQIIEFFLKNWNRFKDYSDIEIVREIYKEAQRVIECPEQERYSKLIPEWNFTIPQIDLYLINHYNNINRRTSLKWLEFTMKLDCIEESSIGLSEEIDDDKLNKILHYNWNDVYSTEAFYNKNLEQINLRLDIKRDFGINCINSNDVKIGNDLNKKLYCELTGVNKRDLPEPQGRLSDFTFGDCFPSYWKFKNPKFLDFATNLSKIRVNLIDKDQDFNFKYNGTSYTIAKGGIHSNDPKRILKPLENQSLRDADVGSQYPNCIRKNKIFPAHLGEKWWEAYTSNIAKRLEAKALYKVTKDKKYDVLQAAFKLVLNGNYGKLKETTNWQYDPFCAMRVTIGSQIDILMLIEALEDNNIHVVSANTDGIVCLFDKSLDKLYYDTCKEWEKAVGYENLGKLEYCDYKLLVQSSVNDYLAIKIDGDIKLKGDFEIEKELHKNNSHSIIPMAVKEYFTKGTDIRDFIKNPDNNILDYCKGTKIKKDFNLESHQIVNGSEVIESYHKIARHYICLKGGTLVKKYISGKLEGHIVSVDTGWKCKVINDITGKSKLVKDYDIDFSYYILATEKFISEIEGVKSQLALF